MRRQKKPPINSGTKTTTGLLVPAPKALRSENVDFLLISEEGQEYHLHANNKTFHMWGLVDTKVEVTGHLQGTLGQVLTVTTYKCVDYFFDETATADVMEELDFDVANFDFAI